MCMQREEPIINEGVYAAATLSNSLFSILYMKSNEIYTWFINKI